MENPILKHPFGPFIFNDSKILILGTFPSIKSFEDKFYYSNPKNQFWKILSKIFNEKIPSTIQEKKDFLKKHKIALWDVCCKCRRKKNTSSDKDLEIIETCDIKNLLKKYPNIKKIATNSRTAQKDLKKELGIDSIYLPSPSLSNAHYTFEEKVERWKKELLELM